MLMEAGSAPWWRSVNIQSPPLSSDNWSQTQRLIQKQSFKAPHAWEDLKNVWFHMMREHRRCDDFLLHFTHAAEPARLCTHSSTCNQNLKIQLMKAAACKRTVHCSQQHKREMWEFPLFYSLQKPESKLMTSCYHHCITSGFLLVTYNINMSSNCKKHWLISVLLHKYPLFMAYWRVLMVEEDI